MKIRLEQPQDYREVENLIREAFWNVYQPGCVEHYLMHQLRKDPCFVPELDYVVEEDGRVVAQIAYAKGTYQPDQGEAQELLLFGPVGVLPEYQGMGFGSALIRFTLDRAKELGWPAVVITGNPAYYSRLVLNLLEVWDPPRYGGKGRGVSCVSDQGAGPLLAAARSRDLPGPGLL